MLQVAEPLQPKLFAQIVGTQAPALVHEPWQLKAPGSAGAHCPGELALQAPAPLQNEGGVYRPLTQLGGTPQVVEWLG
jgi:hypothetical protein